MGVYLNPGNGSFQQAVNSKIYVDKTGLIKYTNEYINTMQRFICISRPRRFGKSMAANMLAAYYGRECDSSEIFAKYKIAEDESYRKNLNQYNVISLNIQDFLSVVDSVEELISYIQSQVLEELKEQYPGKIPEQEKFLGMALAKLFSKTRESFVFIIDEWDCILREKKYASKDQRKYLDFIRNLLKDKIYVSLAYMTGILPIKKYGTHSALNMFDEYSMTEPGDYAEYIGFTER
ncbi:MAG: AAA family ATPase, partial [Lachnospiraceae bacterium]|nr:AAA family ATPase [Lachnospiraceae bacterium]